MVALAAWALLPSEFQNFMAAALLLHALALPRGNVVVEASNQPLASGPPPMDGAAHGDMPAPDYSHIPEEMLPSPGEASPLADIMAWHSQRTLQGMAAPHEAAHEMHGPSAQDVTPASAGQAMTAAPAGQMHDMPAPDFSAIPAGTLPPTRTSPVSRSPALALAHMPAHITNRGPNPQQACCRRGCASRRTAEPMLARTRRGAYLLWYLRNARRGVGSLGGRAAAAVGRFRPIDVQAGSIPGCFA